MHSFFFKKSLLSIARLTCLGLLSASALLLMDTEHVFAQQEQATSQSQEQAEEGKPAKEKKYVPFKKESPLLAVKMGRPTQPLEIASLFYKKAGTEPDFRAWTENNLQYQNALEVDKKKVFTKVYNHIVKRFRELPEDSMINVQPQIWLGEYSDMQSIQVIDSFHERTYFSFDANGEGFAVIPKNMERFHQIFMTPERHQEMTKKTAGDSRLRAEIVMKIIQIDKEKPYELNDEKKYWLLAAEIAEIRLWNMDKEKPALLWRYREPWYKGYTDVEIMRLYDEGRSAR